MPVLFDSLVQMPESFCHSFAQQYGSFFMAGFHCDIHRGFAFCALIGQVGAAHEQSTEDLHVSILGSGMEGGEAALFAQVRIGIVFEEQLDDLSMSACCSRMEGRRF